MTDRLRRLGRWTLFRALASWATAMVLGRIPDACIHGFWVISTAALVAGQSTTIVSVSSAGTQGDFWSVLPAITADGRHVAFKSLATDLVPGDTNGMLDVFVHDRQTGQTIRVSVDSSGAEGDGDVGFGYPPSISADGSRVAFESFATNLVPGDTNGAPDVFVHDLATGETIRVSVDSFGAQGNRASHRGFISGNGRYVVFESDATNLAPGDTNLTSDVFVHDLATGRTTRASLASDGTQGNGRSDLASISADGRYVVFASLASTLVFSDTGGFRDVFVRDRQAGLTTRISLNSSGVQGNGHSGVSAGAISADGRRVVFGGIASNLVPGDTNNAADAFFHDLVTGETSLASMSFTGSPSNNASGSQTISADGRFVSFWSDASNIVAGDTNSASDVFVRDILLGQTTRVSISSSGAQATSGSSSNYLSADGRYVVFESNASNLVPGADMNGSPDVFLRDLGVRPPVGFCFGDGGVASCPCGNNGVAGSGCENSATTGGATLFATGSSSLSADTLVLTGSGQMPSTVSIVIQGSDRTSAASFGDGLICVGGTLLRLYIKSASGGVTTAPQPGDPTISAVSAALGNPVPLGATRHYQIVYRDPVASFCPAPTGNTWNISGGLSILWGP